MTSRTLALIIAAALSACQPKAFEGSEPALSFSSIEVSSPPANEFFWNARQNSLVGPQKCLDHQIGTTALSEQEIEAERTDCLKKNAELVD